MSEKPTPMLATFEGEFKDRDSGTYKSFVFRDGLAKGDCRIAGGAEFRFYRNGSTCWECDIMSSDSGDEWEGKFSGGEVGYNPDTIDGLKKILMVIRNDYNFDISDANLWKHWLLEYPPSAVEYVRNGIGLSEAYDRMAIVAFYCGC
jgi:hypothetical protein